MERTCVHWCERGFPPRVATLHEWATELLRKITDDSEASLGIHWTEGFRERYSALLAVWIERLNVERTVTGNPETLGRFFGLWKELVETGGIPTSHIYNMDEKGVMLGVGHASKALVRHTKRSIDKLMSQPGNREWVTVVEVVSGDNRHLPPMVIFKGKTKDLRWPETLDIEGKYSFIFEIYN